jgi:hypothetical protein
MTKDGTKSGVCERCGHRTGDGAVIDGLLACPDCAAEISRFDESEHGDPEAATYQIETVADFLRVPEDRIADCLAEFADYLTMARGIIEQAEIAGEVVGVPVTAQIDPFKWVDDGRQKRRIEIMGGDPKGGAA